MPAISSFGVELLSRSPLLCKTSQVQHGEVLPLHTSARQVKNSPLILPVPEAVPVPRHAKTHDNDILVTFFHPHPHHPHPHHINLLHMISKCHNLKESRDFDYGNQWEGHIVSWSLHPLPSNLNNSPQHSTLLLCSLTP